MTIKTLKDALENGYIITEWKYQGGYVSRKVDGLQQPVLIAGARRKGQMYVLLPAYNTTRFCYRAYLGKDGAKH